MELTVFHSFIDLIATALGLVITALSGAVLIDTPRISLLTVEIGMMIMAEIYEFIQAARG